MSIDSKIVAVTGASGFIGSHLVTALLANNFHVQVLARNPENIQLNHSRLQCIKGDLHSQSSLNTLVYNADYIVHLAGRVRGAQQHEFNHDNVEGTQNLLSACSQRQPLQKFLFISSLAATQQHISYYSQSKYAAENLVKNSNIDHWTIIRPPAIYGPGDKELMPLFDWMKRGILWIPGNSKQQFSLLHVYDLVNLILQDLSSLSSGECLEPDDGHQYTWELISSKCTKYFQRNIHSIVIPKAVLLSVAKVNMLLSKLSGYAPMLTISKVKELTHDNWLSAGLPSEYTWTANVDLKKGLGTLYSQHEQQKQ